MLQETDCTYGDTARQTSVHICPLHSQSRTRVKLHCSECILMMNMQICILLWIMREGCSSNCSRML